MSSTHVVQYGQRVSAIGNPELSVPPLLETHGRSETFELTWGSLLSTFRTLSPQRVRSDMDSR